MGPSTSGFFILFYFSQFFDVAKTGDHPQDELTKFGYRSERKVETFMNSAIFW